MDDYARRIETYRNKAEEMRVLAHRIRDQNARQMFIDMAADYLDMAQTLERIAAQKPLLDFKP